MSLAFGKNAVLKFRQTGSILPSSRFLARSMAASIPSGKRLVLVELGAGTGSITNAILKKISNQSVLISIEKNEELGQELIKKFRDKRLKIVIGDVSHLKGYCEKFGYLKLDFVISGLPLGNMKKKEREKVIKNVHAILKPNGHFIQFQYFLASLTHIKRFFPTARVRNFEVRNFPPAFIYECRK